MKNLKAIVGALVGLIIIIIMISTCGDDNSDQSTKTVTSTYAADSLLVYLNETVSPVEGVSYEVAKFDESFCRVYVNIPEEEMAYAEVVGSGICTLTTKWLSGKGYDLGLGKLYVSCYVYSPIEAGVTGKARSIRWGKAVYNPSSDSVEWTWEKAE
jgi:hypothetical protein